MISEVDPLLSWWPIQRIIWSSCQRAGVGQFSCWEDIGVSSQTEKRNEHVDVASDDVASVDTAAPLLWSSSVPFP